ncbi:MAG: DUF493 family protein [Bordetella sp.]|nr:MAG: DUF493 family protein [Bordetella sp.]
MKSPNNEFLINYPSFFPIKVVGKNCLDLKKSLIHIVLQFDANFDSSSIETRFSKNKNYLGLTFTIKAKSLNQLNDLYKALTAHPMVKFVL